MAKPFTRAQQEAGARVLWEKQFEGTPWAGKVKLIDPTSLREYEVLAMAVFNAMGGSTHDR
ncbi:MAG: hypothetical protein ACREDR_38190 [Blastocatellia bacterium]